MIVDRPNPSQVTLQVAAQNLDGTPKTALTSAAVRVYRMNGATEVEVLASTAMGQVGSSNIWRYIWVPGTLPVEQYYAEYHLVDTDGADFVDVEGIVIQDFALQVDVALIRETELGRWKIDSTTDEMIFYEQDNTTEIARFDLKNLGGLPDHINIFERVRK